MSVFIMNAQGKYKNERDRLTGNGLCGVELLEKDHKHDSRSVQDYIHVNTYSYLNEYNDDDQYCFRVQFHLVGGTGTAALPTSVATREFDVLNEKFNPHNIFFEMESAPQTIFNNGINSDPLSAFDSMYSDDTRIDIYLFNHSNNFDSQANGIGENSEIIMTNTYLSNTTHDSVTLSHEMGHVFGLFHTWHGTKPCPNPNSNDCENNDSLPYDQHIPELVIRYGDPVGLCMDYPNAAIAGDYVFDTHADNYHPDMHPTYDGCSPGPDDCVAGPCESSSCGDADNQTYIPFTDNIMTYWSPWHCNKQFTVGQAVRMKYFIESNFSQFDYLDTADCSYVPPPSCDDCDVQSDVNTILASVMPTNSTICREYVATRPLTGLSCQGLSPQQIFIDWGDNTLPNQMSTFNNGQTFHIYDDNDTYQVTVSIIINGETCYSDYISIVVDDTCGPPPVCDNCETVSNDILATLHKTTSTCRYYTIDVTQEQLDCYDIYWGTSNWPLGKIIDPGIDIPLDYGFGAQMNNSPAIFTYATGTIVNLGTFSNPPNPPNPPNPIPCHKAKTSCSNFSKSYIYPNPYNPGDVLQIANLEGKKVQQLEIVNISGITIKTIDAKASSVRLTDVKEGIYWLRMITDSGVEMIQFVVNSQKSR